MGDGSSEEESMGVHEDDKNTGVSDNNVKTAEVQDNETEGVQNNNKTMYHPNTNTPVNGVFNCLRKRKGYRYGFNAHIMHYTMTQLSFRSRTKQFKQVGVKSAKAEFEKLHMRESFKPE